MQDMKPREPDSCGSPESQPGQPPGQGLPGDSEPRAIPGTKAEAMGLISTSSSPAGEPIHSRFQKSHTWQGLGGAKEWGRVSAIQLDQWLPVGLCLPLPSSLILIRTHTAAGVRSTALPGALATQGTTQHQWGGSKQLPGHYRGVPVQPAGLLGPLLTWQLALAHTPE